MKVVLIQDVLKLGKAGDVKSVRDGYGRNYLVPQGLAVLATAGAIRQAEDIKKRVERQRASQSTEHQALAARINEINLTFHAKAGETGRLYGSITTALIATKLSEKLGAEVDRRKIDTVPLRDLGSYKVIVYLSADINATFQVHVLREGESERAIQPKAPVAPAPTESVPATA